MDLSAEMMIGSAMITESNGTARTYRSEATPAPGRIIVNDCDDCTHEPDQHADLAGCWGDGGTCPCDQSKATLTEWTGQ